MSFTWPFALVCLLLVPLFGALYVLAQRRRRRFTLRYSSIGLVSAAVGRIGYRRHVPAALFLLSVGAMSLGLARPYASVPDPEATGTVILVIDSSRSMLATDIEPTRIDAAKAAVREFARKQPEGIRIGVVAFSGWASLLTPPTFDRQQVIATVNSLDLGRGTNIGDGLAVAYETLFPPVAVEASVSQGRLPSGPPISSAEGAIIVLLSDGASTTGPSPIEVAKALGKAGVRTYTVGLGTVEGGFVGGGGLRELDEPTLRGIAEATDGKYFSAENASQLSEVYSQIATNNELVTKHMEVTFLAAGVAMVLSLTGGLLGAFWFNRLP